MKPIQRPYQTDEDYWCIREFLREVSLHTSVPGAGAGDNRHDFSWSLLRWDYWRWHVNENIFHMKLEDVVTLATVSSYGIAAHALYESMGLTEFDLLEPWIKEW